MQDRQREVPPAALRRRLVHLQHVLEAEQIRRPRPIVDEAVEGREQRRAAGERPVERLGIDAPPARDALDHRGLARVADVDGLHRHRRAPRPRDPERAQAPRVADRQRLLARDDRGVRWVDALREVPQSLPPPAAGHRDLAAHGQKLEHLRHVAVVRPARRRPRLDVGVRDVAGDQRAADAQQAEDVAAEAVVAVDPPAPPPRRGAIGAVGSSCRNVRRSTTASTPAGRWASSSCALTATRRASASDSRCAGPSGVAAEGIGRRDSPARRRRYLSPPSARVGIRCRQYSADR
jgi:hypothetical protein